FSLDGGTPAVLGKDYAVDPVWGAGGRFMVYSGLDVGTTFVLKSATADGRPYPIPPPTLPRGARRPAFPGGTPRLRFLKGEIQHKDLWSVDLTTGVERPLTKLAPDFDVTNFDLSADGREVVLERLEQRSDVILMDLPKP